MKTRKIYYRFASMILAILCTIVSLPTSGLSGAFTVYAEETTETVEPIDETTEEPTQEVDDVYLDTVNGVSYYYYGYSDGTATIYNIGFTNGAVLEFPTTINSYTVTKISYSAVGSSTNRVEFSAVRIPESITYLDGSPFAFCDIGTLFYNTNATNSGYATGSIFANATISNLVIGNNVEYIGRWTFDNATFLFSELTLSVITIAQHAFRGVWDESNPGALTITDKVEVIETNAFSLNHFSSINYNSSATTDAWSGQQGVFYHSYIDALNIGETSTHIGAYMFYETYPSFHELTIDVPSIGEGAFGEMWEGEQKATLTLTENVIYFEDRVFISNNFSTVNYNCNASVKDEYGSSGIFYHCNIDSLLIAPTVTVIPQYVFNQTYFGFDNLTIDVERIEKRAFGYLWAEQSAGTLTLTERVNFIGTTAFGYGNFTKLNYNADADGESGYDTETIFYQANIGDLAIGSNVTKLPDWLFYKAKFLCDELNVNVETIGEYAFGHAWNGAEAGVINIGERVSYIRPSAFAYGNFEVVNYKANADGESSYNTESIFYQANVGELNIDECVTKLPGWLFYYTYFGCDEITVNVEVIGENAFGFLWSTSEAGTLHLGERVSYIYPAAFASGKYKTVDYKANADGESKSSNDSIFGSSTIAELNIGDNVTKLPNYLFYKAKFTFQELTVDVASIGKSAFGYTWTNSNPAILTIGSKVEQIGEQAFVSNIIEDLNYNASATVDTSSSYGSFYSCKITNLDIGDNVELIGKALFYNSTILDTELVVNAKTVESNAFANAWKSANPVNLTIGEDVEVINSRAFAANYVNKLQFNAKNAVPTTTASGYNGPFNGDTITELTIGDTVEHLTAYTFYGIKLTQEDLRIPDSVKTMGKSVFQNSNFTITNLYIGSGLEDLKYDTFGQALTLSNIYVETVTANDTYKGTSLMTNAIKNYLPVAENVYIHNNSDFSYFFTVKASNVVSSCVDYMEETIGEEYLDEATAQYITPTYDICEICRYQTTSFAYVDAHMISFYVDGVLYHTAYAKDGGSIESPVEPVKEGYNFKGWDADYSNITSDLDINAEFEIKTYTVIFKDYDGTVIETQNVEHGSFAFEPAQPSREGYTFKAWDKDFSNITADMQITATYDINYYNVTFVDHDGIIIETQSIAYGDGATAPNEPVRDGYTFKGWSENFDTISRHLTVTAVYEINKYTVTILDYDGTVLETLIVEHGSSVTPTEPTREGYSFVGWDKPLENITESTSITALYEINTYTVVFKDHDGTILSTQTIEHGSSAVAPENPSREGYDFMGWTHSFNNITSDKTIEAIYMIKVFSVIFKDLENIISEQQIAYGGSAIEPNAPTRPEEEWGQWIFKGWDAVWDFITENTVINAIFDKVFNSYIVTFKDYDGTIIETQSIVHGENAVPPANPTREGYAFTGWDGSNENITGNRTITAQYQICYYTVTFVDYDGTVIDTQTIAYGGNATVPTAPVREGHTFTQWSGTWEDIKKDETVTAIYDVNTYVVTFADYDGAIIDTQNVSHGDNAIVPENPIREGYDFTGWDKEYTNIQADTEITATYTIKILTVIFKDNTNIISTQQIPYGSDAVEPETPSRPEEEWGVWIFKEWDNTWTNIKDNIVINAVFEKKLNQYTVTFVDYNGSVIDTQTVFHGNSATAPNVSAREGYTFKRWDKDFSNITADMEIIAIYDINYYNVIFVDYDGTIIDTQSIAYGNGAVAPNEPVREGYTFVGWDKPLGNIKESTSITALYEINTYTVVFKDYDGTILSTQIIEYGSSATAPENPSREGYDFMGWSHSFDNITSDKTIEAMYMIKVFSVIFKDFENIISEQQIAYGDSAIEPIAPTRPEEEWGQWIFKGWDAVWDFITENTVINAIFDKVFNSYTVTFKDYDGTIIETQSIVHGENAVLPANPTREGYAFSGWDNSNENITENRIITAQYQICYYTVTFVDYDGTVIDTQTIAYGESAIVPTEPVREGHTFTGWSGTWEDVKKDETVVAVYDINIYKVDFVDYDGTIIDRQFIEHGKGATAPESPTRDGYAFKKWDKDFSKVTENLIIIAVYEKNHVHEYTEETERKDATCIEKGYVLSKCSCGDIELKELDVDSDNHIGETEVRDEKAATCTEKGYTGDTYCKSCKEKISDGSENDLEEHTPGETRVENRVEPTTEAKGSYDEVIYCEICSKELSRTQKEIPMLEPDEPDDSEEEDEPEDSEEPSEPDEPEDSEEPNEPDEPEDSEEPNEPDEPEDSEEPNEPDEPEDSEEPTETESDPEEPTEPADDEKENSIEDIVIPIVAATGVTGGVTMLAIVYWRRRRKIYGNLLDKQGNPIANAKVYLEGKDVLETVTDENGYFEFKNLKAGLYKFMLCNNLDVLLVEAELYTDEQNIEEAVTIIESKCEVEFEKENKNISFIITI